MKQCKVFCLCFQEMAVMKRFKVFCLCFQEMAVMKQCKVFCLCFQEMAVMKQVVLSLSERKMDPGRAKTKDFRPSKSLSATSRRFHQAFETHDDPNVVKPGAVHMVRSCYHGVCL